MGHLSEEYHGGGYHFDLNFTNETRTLDTLKEFKDHFWVDKQTRVIYMDFVVFNLNLRLINVVKYVYSLKTYK